MKKILRMLLAAAAISVAYGEGLNPLAAGGLAPSSDATRISPAERSNLAREVSALEGDPAIASLNEQIKALVIQRDKLLIQKLREKDPEAAALYERLLRMREDAKTRAHADALELKKKIESK